MDARTKNVSSTVRRALRSLQGGVPPPFTAETLAQNPDRHLFRLKSLTPQPIFYRVGSEFRCAQDSFFGFYLLSQGIRSCISAVNFQIAGFHCVDSELYAPASALFYTSAYHALSGFLAINGRVLFDSMSFTWLSQEEAPSVIAACLTKKNAWTYEARARSHKSRWLELQAVFSLKTYTVPECFRRLFRYLYQGRLKKGSTLINYLDDPELHRAQLEDYLPEFLTRIAEIRHVALYRSSGEDPGAVEALLDGESVSQSSLGRQAQHLGLFSQSLLEETAKAVSRLVEGVRVHRDVRPFLYLATGQPWIDTPRTDLWEPNTIQGDVDFVQEWLKTCCEEDPVAKA